MLNKLDFTNFFSTNLEYGQAALSDLFLLNIDEIKSTISNINSPYYHKDCNKFYENVHFLCLKYLKNYFLKIGNYFPSVNNTSILSDLEFTLNNYLLLNIKLTLYLSSINTQETITFNKAVNNYITKLDKNYAINEPYYHKINIDNKKRNLIKKFTEFSKQNNVLSENSVFSKSTTKNGYYKLLSHIFIFTLDNWNKCKYNNCKFDKTNNYKYLKEFCTSFFSTCPDIKDLYFFERIFNIRYSLLLYFLPKESISNLSEDNLSSLVNILFPIIYLPDVFDNDCIINAFIDLYKNFYFMHNMTEFLDGIKQLCLDFSSYFIPLYNMLYSNIIHLYLNDNKNNFNEFIFKTINLQDNFDPYKKSFNIFLDKKTFSEYFKLLKPNVFQENKLSKNDTLSDIICFITKNFDFKLFDKRLIIDSLSNFNNNIIKSTVTDKDIYQTNLKNLILSILNSKNIDLIN